MTDEREGKPSASNKWLLRCLGAGELIRQFPSFEEDNSGDANTGSHRHKLIEDEATVFKTTEEEYVVTRALQLRDEARAIVFDEGHRYKITKERRYWLTHDFEKMMSGKYDEMCHDDKTALIIDYKTLNGDHGHAKANGQLLRNAVIVDEVFDFEEVYVALIQPNLEGENQLTMCKYDKPKLIKARKTILDWLLIYNTDGNGRSTGEHCKFCPVRLRCPDNLGTRFELINETTDLAETITPEYMEKVDLAFKLIDDLKKNVRAKALEQLRKDPESLKGYKINKGKTTTEVDTIRAWAKLVQIMGGATFARACKVSMPELTKAYQEATCSDKSLAALRKELEEFLGDCVTKKEGKETIGKG